MDLSSPLKLHEEMMLLALREKEGTFATGYPEYVIAGAILAELVLDHHIEFKNLDKKLVEIHSTKPVDDPVIDQCIAKMADDSDPATLQTWVTRISTIDDLSEKIARQLCERRILEVKEDQFLFIFKRHVYPEINPAPEKNIINRLHQAIFTDQHTVDPRTVVLISLADAADLLDQTFSHEDIESRRARIKQITDGELTGDAVKEVIAAYNSAMMVAATMPGIIST